MSLRIFHICFILISTMLCAFVSWWCFTNEVGKFYACAFALFGATLPPYGVWFIRKSRALVQ